MTSSHILKIKTKEGYNFKVLAEYLKNVIKKIPLSIDEKGIRMSCPDIKKRTLINIDLFRESFNVFKIAHPVNIHINSSSFYKVLKSIRKEDGVSFAIDKNEPFKLVVTPEQTKSGGLKVDFRVNIIEEPEEEIEIVTNYKGNPVVVDPKSFQKAIRLINPTSAKVVSIASDGNKIRIFSDCHQVYDGKIELGGDNEDDHPLGGWGGDLYSETFDTSLITNLLKVAGLSSTVAFHAISGMPLKIRMTLGPLGTIIVYIKSNEMLEQEEGGAVSQDDVKTTIDDEEGLPRE